MSKSEVQDALAKKSNKNDLEMILRLIKQMHSHTSSIVRTIVESQRALVDAS